MFIFQRLSPFPIHPHHMSHNSSPAQLFPNHSLSPDGFSTKLDPGPVKIDPGL